MKGDKINKMHNSPFRLLQITLTDEKGKLVKKPISQKTDRKSNRYTS
jgi:hypothetical protein